MRIVKFAVIAVLLGVGGYFGFGWAKKWQLDLNAKADKAAAESDGGELGHIAELHSVLDATDPNRFQAGEEESLRRLGERQAAAMAAASAAAGGSPMTPQPMPERELPVVPAVWTLELSEAKIPNGKANGTISGMEFLVDSATLSRTAQSYLLSLRQGTGPLPDHEFQIFLKPDPSGNLLGRTWEISGERTPQTPQVIKRWKPNPRFAARQRTFSSGYILKLELGQVKDERVSGKIYLALPDEEKSVVAGVFSIQIPPSAAAMGLMEE